MITISRHLGISLPDFLGPNFDLAWDTVTAKLGTSDNARKMFGMGWHGFAYRAITMNERADRYCSMPPYGSESHEGNFREDQALVDFLFAVCSAVDCFVFAAYAIGTAVDPSQFPSNKAAHLIVNRKSVTSRFEDAWKAERITTVLIELRDRLEIELLYQFRDVVLHRGVMPRTLYVGGHQHGTVTTPSQLKVLPDVWVSDYTLGAASVKDWQGILNSCFSVSSDCMQQFAKKL